jgi:hypothetical protein
MRRRQPEQTIQRALFEHIRMRGVDGLVAIHVPNSGYRSRVEAKILVGLGCETAGVPDLLLWHAAKAYAVELKSEDGRIADSQIAMLDRLSQARVITAVAYGLGSAVRILEDWNLLRGKTQ